MAQENETKEMTLQDIGYSLYFDANRKKLGFAVSQMARVTVEHKGVYGVINERGQFLARVTGKRMFDASSREDFPAVGDWVAVAETAPERAVIQGILPRKTVIKRKHGGNKTGVQIIGTNIDVAFVVESVDRDYNLNRFERYVVLARDGGVKPAIILNKIDFIGNEDLNSKLKEIRGRFAGVDIVSTSIANEQGLDELRTYMEHGKTYCFLGSSGVGKSSLINALIGRDNIQTGSISSYSRRGKHVTTKREMFFLPNGGIVIDNPGMREVGMTDANSGIDRTFDEIFELVKCCKYADCSHRHELGCAVLAAVRSGQLDAEKYNNYLNLKKETEFYGMSSLEKRQKDRRFGEFIKKAKKDFKKYG